MKFTLTYLRGGAGRGVDGPGKGGSGLLGIGLRLCTKQDDFQPFKTVFKWSQGRALKKKKKAVQSINSQHNKQQFKTTIKITEF